MYEDDKGQFKGDALVVYFRPESVNLAIQMLDDSDFRLGVEGPMGKMRVQAADFSYKSQQEAPPKSSKKDLKKVIKRTQKLNRWVGITIATETWADACLVNWPTGTMMTHLYSLIQVRGGTRLSFSSTCSHFRSLKSVLS
jgi:hypothetical protein